MPQPAAGASPQPVQIPPTMQPQEPISKKWYIAAALGSIALGVLTGGLGNITLGLIVWGASTLLSESAVYLARRWTHIPTPAPGTTPDAVHKTAVSTGLAAPAPDSETLTELKAARDEASAQRQLSAKLQATVDGLNQNLSQSQKELQNARTLLRGTEARANESTQKASQANQQVTTLQSQITDLQTTHRDLVTKGQAEHSQLEASYAQIAQLAKEKEQALQEMRGSLTAESQKLKEEGQQSKTQIADLQRQYSQLQTQFRDLTVKEESERQALTKSSDSLDRVRREHAQELKQMQSDLTERQSEAVRWHQEAITYDQQLRGLRQELEVLRSSAKEPQAKVAPAAPETKAAAAAATAPPQPAAKEMVAAVTTATVASTAPAKEAVAAAATPSTAVEATVKKQATAEPRKESAAATREEIAAIIAAQDKMRKFHDEMEKYFRAVEGVNETIEDVAELEGKLQAAEKQMLQPSFGGMTGIDFTLLGTIRDIGGYEEGLGDVTGKLALSLVGLEMTKVIQEGEASDLRKEAVKAGASTELVDDTEKKFKDLDRLLARAIERSLKLSGSRRGNFLIKLRKEFTNKEKELDDQYPNNWLSPHLENRLKTISAEYSRTLVDYPRIIARYSGSVASTSGPQQVVFKAKLALVQADSKALSTIVCDFREGLRKSIDPIFKELIGKEIPKDEEEPKEKDVDPAVKVEATLKPDEFVAKLKEVRASLDNTVDAHMTLIQQESEEIEAHGQAFLKEDGPLSLIEARVANLTYNALLESDISSLVVVLSKLDREYIQKKEQEGKQVGVADATLGIQMGHLRKLSGDLFTRVIEQSRKWNAETRGNLLIGLARAYKHTPPPVDGQSEEKFNKIMAEFAKVQKEYAPRIAKYTKYVEHLGKLAEADHLTLKQQANFSVHKLNVQARQKRLETVAGYTQKDIEEMAKEDPFD